jgi:hypothetical protein
MDLISPAAKNLPDPEGLAHRLSPIKEEAPIKQNETIRNDFHISAQADLIVRPQPDHPISHRLANERYVTSARNPYVR